MSKQELSTMIGVHIRDLSIIDETPKNRYEASILGNENAILVSVEGIKCIMLSDEVFVFCPENHPAKVFISTFQSVLVAIKANDIDFLQAHGFSSANLHHETRFEHVVLEVILLCACALINETFVALLESFNQFTMLFQTEASGSSSQEGINHSTHSAVNARPGPRRMTVDIHGKRISRLSNHEGDNLGSRPTLQSGILHNFDINGNLMRLSHLVGRPTQAATDAHNDAESGTTGIRGYLKNRALNIKHKLQSKKRIKAMIKMSGMGPLKLQISRLQRRVKEVSEALHNVLHADLVLKYMTFAPTSKPSTSLLNNYDDVTNSEADKNAGMDMRESIARDSTVDFDRPSESFNFIPRSSDAGMLYGSRRSEAIFPGGSHRAQKVQYVKPKPKRKQSILQMAASHKSGFNHTCDDKEYSKKAPLPSTPPEAPQVDPEAKLAEAISAEVDTQEVEIILDRYLVQMGWILADVDDLSDQVANVESEYTISILICLMQQFYY